MNQEKTNIDRIWDISTKLLLPVTAAACVLLLNLNVRVSRIEENRFTDRDGFELAEKIRKDIAESYPPKWLSDAVTRLEGMLQKNALSLEKLDERINQIEMKNQ